MKLLILLMLYAIPVSAEEAPSSTDEEEMKCFSCYQAALPTLRCVLEGSQG